jgi:hypothetical protein
VNPILDREYAIEFGREICRLMDEDPSSGFDDALLESIGRRAFKRAHQWQPIETAPDGVRVLLWLEPTRIAMPFERRDGCWMGDDYPLNMATATHWMPMPSPPEERS